MSDKPWVPTPQELAQLVDKTSRFGSEDDASGENAAKNVHKGTLRYGNKAGAWKRAKRAH